MRWLFLILFACAACGSPKVEVRPGVLTVSQEQTAAWVRNFNPLLSGGMARWPTANGIFEPLMIFNPMSGEHVPWLATSIAWVDGTQVLEVELREGVLWSDGEPFDASDMAFTLELLKAQRALDGSGLWTHAESTEQVGTHTVRVTFTKPYAPGRSLVGGLIVVPEHIWGSVEDPVRFANPEPVATGPFTEVLRFDPQVWELGRNERYWRGPVAIEALRFPAFPSNEQATLALIHGEVDWAANFVPAIDRIFVERDPQHHHYWFPAVAGSIYLYPNHGHPALSDVRVRKAISHALDRARIVQVAMYDYTTPADATGLSEGHGAWKDRQAVADWARHDADRAQSLLSEAGWEPGIDGMRRDAQGEPLTLEISTVAGWSDWVRAAQVIANDLRSVGVDARIRSHDFSAWFERLQRGDFDLSIGWTVDGASPYAHYRAMMSSSLVKPAGEVAALNWHRYGSVEADRLLDAWARSPDPKAQRGFAHELQALFLEQAPAIPLFLNPSWGECSSRRFTGWPSAENPYARLSPNHGAEALLVMNELQPAGTP